MPLQKVSEAKTLEVGKYYLVPCVRTLDPNHYRFGLRHEDKGGFVPINGELHGDADLDIPELHYHYDWRFIKQIFGYGILVNIQELGGKPIAFSEIEFRKKRCYRAVVEFPFGLCTKLEKIYQSSKLNCGVCPHRRFQLNIPPDSESNVICPGHGLKWNVESGEMVSRL